MAKDCRLHILICDLQLCCLWLDVVLDSLTAKLVENRFIDREKG